MKEYTEQEYKEQFGEKAWLDKVYNTLSSYEKKKGIESVYATDLGNIFIINLKQEYK